MVITETHGHAAHFLNALLEPSSRSAAVQV